VRHRPEAERRSERSPLLSLALHTVHCIMVRVSDVMAPPPRQAAITASSTCISRDGAWDTDLCAWEGDGDDEQLVPSPAPVAPKSPVPPAVPRAPPGTPSASHRPRTSSGGRASTPASGQLHPPSRSAVMPAPSTDPLAYFKHAIPTVEVRPWTGQGIRSAHDHRYPRGNNAAVATPAVAVPLAPRCGCTPPLLAHTARQRAEGFTAGEGSACEGGGIEVTGPCSAACDQAAAGAASGLDPQEQALRGSPPSAAGRSTSPRSRMRRGRTISSPPPSLVRQPPPWMPQRQFRRVRQAQPPPDWILSPGRAPTPSGRLHRGVPGLPSSPRSAKNHAGARPDTAEIVGPANDPLVPLVPSTGDVGAHTHNPSYDTRRAKRDLQLVPGARQALTQLEELYWPQAAAPPPLARPPPADPRALGPLPPSTHIVLSSRPRSPNHPASLKGNSPRPQQAKEEPPTVFTPPASARGVRTPRKVHVANATIATHGGLPLGVFSYGAGSVLVDHLGITTK
jgi:hypothetical protein